MEIPASFKNKIAGVFYKTRIEVRPITEVADSEGGVKKAPGATSSIFYGNAQPVSAQLAQSLLGQNIEAEIKITAPETAPVATGTLLALKDEMYEVTDCKRYDSHTEILARRWKVA